MHAGKGWAAMVEIWGGAAACRHFAGWSLAADDIRDDYSASVSDANAAEEIARHFWPDHHVESVLDRSAETAGVLVQQPEVRLAITRVANYLAVRRNIHITEAETLVRRHIPGAIECPGTAWAVGLAKR